MKSQLNKKLFKIAAVEILLQLGFEKCTEESLNVLSEVFSYYIDRCIGNNKEIILLSNSYKSDKKDKEAHHSKKNIEDEESVKKVKRENVFSYTDKTIILFLQTYNLQISELIQFCSQQIALTELVRHSSDEMNMLGLLKFLPREQSIKAAYKTSLKTNLFIEDEIFEKKEDNFKSTSRVNIIGTNEEEVEKDSEESKNEREEGGGVESEQFFKTFIEKCTVKYKKIEEKKFNQDYLYDLEEVIEETFLGTKPYNENFDLEKNTDQISNNDVNNVNFNTLSSNNLYNNSTYTCSNLNLNDFKMQFIKENSEEVPVSFLDDFGKAKKIAIKKKNKKEHPLHKD
ncbi:hypothetical protein EHP00_737 [Ecytonucleospora hepatopenaei]|uniref:Uncharacterized protein n=1 Tax=Ecytonucleospora hepatopenaei TaxID=646526 RepID=A0A1W0E3A0_9MICR|nr:hypothetical protein EHP00_737 [Ecytonucleospora hepatopenaei]